MPYASPRLAPRSGSFRLLGDANPMERRAEPRGFALRTRASVTLFTGFFVFFLTRLHCEHTKMEIQWQPFTARKMSYLQQVVEPQNQAAGFSGSLPRGIVEANSDMELKPLWNNPRLKGSSAETYAALLAIPVGITQKENVDVLVRKFLSENCSVILFHYDGNVDGWRNLEWSDNAVHITALNQTKWWFAKRFLHPDVVSAYAYIFLWDEDLGVENFHPGRYLRIMISEGLEISQPALDPNQSEVHHRITIRNSTVKVHRRVYGFQGSLNCSDRIRGPPCTGWVEGMAPVFSRVAWRCAWHLIQNDLIHGWGLDMKLGYCAQGDPTRKVGVIDGEFIIHKGIPTLGGSTQDKHFDNHPSKNGASKLCQDRSINPRSHVLNDRSIHLISHAHNDRSVDLRSHAENNRTTDLRSHAHNDRPINLRSHAHNNRPVDLRSRTQNNRIINPRPHARNNMPINLRSHAQNSWPVNLRSNAQKNRQAQNNRPIDLRSHIRRQSTAELAMFRRRWEKAVREDEDWSDPFEET